MTILLGVVIGACAGIAGAFVALALKQAVDALRDKRTARAWGLNQND